MKVKIEFNIDGSAFEDDDREVDKVLVRAAEKIYHNRLEENVDDIYDEFTANIRDTYGNTVGTVAVEGD